MVDKEYCMSSYLAFRFIADGDKQFKEGITHKEHELIPVGKKDHVKRRMI